MLHIEIPEMELFDEKTSTFFVIKKESLQLEHSLVSLSKWESTWCKPFLDEKEKTEEELLDYIRCMTITQNVKSETYKRIPDAILLQIKDYINAPMTATWFAKEKTKQTKKEIITAEIIYYWMFAQGVPLECQKWHLNRLLTLLQVCSIKNGPKKKQGRRDMLSERNALNEARRKELGTRG